MKVLIKDNRTFLIKDPGKDVHTQFGYIKASHFKKKAGTVLKTNKDVEMTLLNAGFLDKLRKIKRGAQVIPLKDIGSIIAETGINNKTTVLDGGAGSGYMALCLANVAKKVTTYEIRQDHHDIVKKNIEFMGFKNMTLKLGNIREAKEKVDVINLDLPEPWECFDMILRCLKVGGYCISYSPTIPQVMDFVRTLRTFPELHYINTIEIIEREWEIMARKVRPKTQGIGHSGFLTYLRRIR